MKNDRTKLSLRRERVRTLTAEHLAGAAGGNPRTRLCTGVLCPQDPGPFDPTDRIC